MDHARCALLAAIVLLLASLGASAGDFATLNFIGFSKDGRYLAFEEHGTHDGSGFPYSDFYFLDVVKNSFAAAPVRVRIENEAATERQARNRARIKATPLLRKFRIAERNTGQMVVSRLLTDVAVNNFLSADPDKTQTVNFAEIIGSMYRLGDYDLILKPTEIRNKDCDYSDRPIYKLQLSLKEKEQNKSITLQNDNALPSSRACPIHYAIQYVYLYENNIAVFLNTYHIGFEGPDMRYMAVTGKFK